jgi:menaquinone-dependent protoporphyrinogen oxidase
MASIAIVYGSSEGQTARIARFIADVMAEDGHVVELVDSHSVPPDFDPGKFDGVLVGASVHVGKHDQTIVNFARENLDALQCRPSAFFSVSLTAAGDTEKEAADIGRVIEQFSERTGWQPEKTGVFAGALAYSQYNPVVRFVLKRISASHDGDTDTSRDYEYTDWDDVARFAKQFLNTLAA